MACRLPETALSVRDGLDASPRADMRRYTSKVCRSGEYELGLRMSARIASSAASMRMSSGTAAFVSSNHGMQLGQVHLARDLSIK